MFFLRVWRSLANTKEGARGGTWLLKLSVPRSIRQLSALNFRLVCPPPCCTSSGCPRAISDAMFPKLNSLSSLSPQLPGLLCPPFSKWQNYPSIYSIQKPRSYPGSPLSSHLPCLVSMLPNPMLNSVVSSQPTAQQHPNQMSTHFQILSSLSLQNSTLCQFSFCLFSTAKC